MDDQGVDEGSVESNVVREEAIRVGVEREAEIKG
jgi:hypothetical protein